MKIRYAKDSDFDFLVTGLEATHVLEKRKTLAATDADKKTFRRGIRNTNIRILEDDAGPVGFLHFMTDFRVLYLQEKIFWIDLVFVNEKMRGKGLGKKLYQDAVQLAKNRGFKRVIIDIFAANTNSLGFHKKLGFNEIYGIYEKSI